MLSKELFKLYSNICVNENKIWNVVKILLEVSQITFVEFKQKLTFLTNLKQELIPEFLFKLNIIESNEN